MQQPIEDSGVREGVTLQPAKHEGQLRVSRPEGASLVFWKRRWCEKAFHSLGRQQIQSAPSSTPAMSSAADPAIVDDTTSTLFQPPSL